MWILYLFPPALNSSLSRNLSGTENMHFSLTVSPFIWGISFLSLLTSSAVLVFLALCSEVLFSLSITSLRRTCRPSVGSLGMDKGGLFMWRCSGGSWSKNYLSILSFAMLLSEFFRFMISLVKARYVPTSLHWSLSSSLGSIKINIKTNSIYGKIARSLPKCNRN